MPAPRFDMLFRPCPWPFALGLALAIGAAHALAMLPVGVILGTADFWTFPRGIVPGGQVDMASTLVGYRYLAQAPWMLPLLWVPNITPPSGMNAFWLDPVPWLGLLARPVSALAGSTVNLLGWFLFLAFALPGVAMAALLRAAGARGLLAAAAAALLADPMPSLLIESGHIALCAQVLLIAALALYVSERRRAGWHNDWQAGRAHPWAWLCLLALTFLTHLYLFVMVGGIWAAAWLQAVLEGREGRGRLALRAVLTVAVIVALGLATGILSRDAGAGGSNGFGIFSINLASPFLPQLSGAIPPLRGYWVGMHSQVLAWAGLGAWLVLLAAALAWLRRDADGRTGLHGLLRRHAALAVLLLGYVAFALSSRLTLGSHVLLDLPLPERLAYALGAFRGSGRFIWPVNFAVLALALLTLLRQQRRGAVLAVLAVAGGLQVLDAGPLRAAIAASTAQPAAPVLDRARAAEMIASASALMVFPSVGCVEAAIADLPAADRPATELRLNQADVELELIASRHNLPLNTVVNSRLATDCVAEAVERRAPLRPGVAYFYLDAPAPAAEQLGGHDPATVCAPLDWLLACRLPA